METGPIRKVIMEAALRRKWWKSSASTNKNNKMETFQTIFQNVDENFW